MGNETNLPAGGLSEIKVPSLTFLSKPFAAVCRLLCMHHHAETCRFFTRSFPLTA